MEESVRELGDHRSGEEGKKRENKMLYMEIEVSWWLQPKSEVECGKWNWLNIQIPRIP